MQLNKIDLVLIELEKGRSLTSDTVEKELSIKKNTFHKAIEILKSEGYEITATDLGNRTRSYSLVI